MPRRPSPRICEECLRPHVRLPSRTRAARRRLLERILGSPGVEKVTYCRYPCQVCQKEKLERERHSRLEDQTYALALFDHITLGEKTGSGLEIRQLHPAPAPPEDWTARSLQVADRAVMLSAYGAGGGRERRP